MDWGKTLILAALTLIPMSAHAQQSLPCDPGVMLTAEERKALLNKLRISKAGQKLVHEFESHFNSTENLILQWDSVSYSQIGNNRAAKGRAPAAVKTEVVCIHLAKRLPEIEHVADLAHELVHATKLEPAVLRGEVETAEEFVSARIKAQGGEAEAFATECLVKRELLGKWDHFCAPYAGTETIDQERVVEDLYSGQLSASLTGEAYPKMLSRQFEMIALKRAARQAVKSPRNSALENKGSIQ